MGVKGRALVFSAALLAASAMYGKQRFDASRYKTQCEHLPGICIYGEGGPARARLSLKGNPRTRMEKRLRIKVGDGSLSVTGIYTSNGEWPRTVVLEDGHGTISCKNGPGQPVQIVLSAEKTLAMKGVKGGFGPLRTGEAAILGIQEIFGEPAPISIDCEKIGGSLGETPHHMPKKKRRMGKRWRELVQLQQTALGLEKKIGGAAEAKNTYDECSIEAAKWHLAKALRSQGIKPLKRAISHSRYVVAELENDLPPVRFKSQFWRGWDVAFALGMFAGIVLAISNIGNSILWSLQMARRKEDEEAAKKCPPAPGSSRNAK